MVMAMHHSHATEDDARTCEEVQTLRRRLDKLESGGRCPECGHIEEQIAINEATGLEIRGQMEKMRQKVASSKSAK